MKRINLLVLVLFCFVLFITVQSFSQQFGGTSGPYNGGNIPDFNKSASVFFSSGWRYGADGWQHPAGIDGSFGRIIANLDGKLLTWDNAYYSSIQPALKYSTNEGISWDSLFLNLSDPRPAYISCFALDKEDNYLTGANGIWRSSNGSAWTLLGSGSGLDVIDVYEISVSGDTILVATPNGVWRSTDNGVTWNQSGLSDFLVISIAHQFDAVWYAGTKSNGLFMSADAGDSWTSIDFVGIPPPTGETYCNVRVAVHPSGTIFAITRPDLYSEISRGIFRSTDNGLTWRNANSGLLDSLMNGITVAPNGNVYASENFDGILVSSNEGVSWDVIGTPAAISAVFVIDIPSPPLSKNQLFLSEVHADTTSVALAVSNYHPYLSTNGGNKWKRFTFGESNDATYAATVNSNGTMFIALRNEGIFRSSDGGSVWEQTSFNGLLGINRNTMIVGTTGTVFVGTQSNGVWRSTDTGDTWEPPNSGDDQAIICVASSNASRSFGFLFAGTLFDVYKSTDDGMNWTPCGLDAYGYIKSITIDDSANVFAVIASGALMKSTDDGATWEPVGSLMRAIAKSDSRSLSSVPTEVTTLAAKDEALFAGTNNAGLYKTTDGGTNWENASVGLKSQTIASISIPNSRYVYVATGAGVYRSLAPLGSAELTFVLVNGWNLLSVPIIKSDYYTANLFPQATSDAFTFYGSYETTDTLIPGNGYWLKTPAGNVYQAGGYITELSVPVQTGWNMVGSLTNPINVSSIGSIPGGMTTSPFYSYNPGAGSYETATTVMPMVGYWVKTSDAGTLVFGGATTLSKIVVVPTNELPPPPPGEWDVSSDVIPKKFALYTNYPNPFNPTTTIRFDIPKPTRVTLRVFNVLGQEVARLINGAEYDAGEYQIPFDGSRLGSGMYFYRLEAEKFTNVKTMLLLK